VLSTLATHASVESGGGELTVQMTMASDLAGAGR